MAKIRVMSVVSMALSLGMLALLVIAVVQGRWLALAITAISVVSFEVGRRVGIRLGTASALAGVQRRLRLAREQSGRGR